MTILVTGGHLTPALAFIDYVQAHHPDQALVFAGRALTQRRNNQQSHEADEIATRHIPFIQVDAPKLTDLKSLTGIIHFISLMLSVWKARQHLRRHRIDIVISFGGYLAIPWTLAAKLLHIPIMTHEQTHTAGVANRWIAKWANVVAVSHADSKNHFPRQKVVVTGNPIRSQLVQQQPQPQWLTPVSTAPLLYVTGGNQGSAIINQVIGECLPELLAEWQIVHQCGNPTADHDYAAELQQVRSQLPKKMQHQYFIQPWISTEELAWLYQHTAAVVSRAGANTVNELELFAIPAVLIPLPFAHHQEQLLNAQAYQKSGLALIIDQTSFDRTSLVKALTEIKQKIAPVKKPRHIPASHTAAAQLYQLAHSLVIT